MDTKRIVLLYGNAGGGHRSAAEAIALGLHTVYGNAAQTSLVDGLHNAPFLVKELVETYPQIVNQARSIYALGYHAINDRRRLSALRVALEPLTEPRVEDLLLNNPADIYVSCHPLFNSAVPRALHQMGRSACFIHVVTDLVSGHVMHYDESADFLIVPTEQARQDALANHVPSSKIAVTGQPVSPDFKARSVHGTQMRQALGFDERPILLLMGGGDGMGRLELIAREIMLSKLPIQLIIVCGRNQELKEHLEFVNPRIPTRIFGFVKNMPELMGAADILATKAGPSTICEGFIAGLPIILYDAVPGQEEGNVDYVVSSGAGAWCPNPHMFKKQLQHWIDHPREFRATKMLSSKLAKPYASLEIAKIVGHFCGLSA